MIKELDRIHDAVSNMDGKIDALRTDVYQVGKTQERYAERVDNLVSRVSVVETEQRAARRIAITTLVGVIGTLGTILAQAFLLD